MRQAINSLHNVSLLDCCDLIYNVDFQNNCIDAVYDISFSDDYFGEISFYILPLYLNTSSNNKVLVSAISQRVSLKKYAKSKLVRLNTGLQEHSSKISRLSIVDAKTIASIVENAFLKKPVSYINLGLIINADININELYQSGGVISVDTKSTIYGQASKNSILSDLNADLFASISERLSMDKLMSQVNLGLIIRSNINSGTLDRSGGEVSTGIIANVLEQANKKYALTTDIKTTMSFAQNSTAINHISEMEANLKLSVDALTTSMAVPLLVSDMSSFTMGDVANMTVFDLKFKEAN